MVVQIEEVGAHAPDVRALRLSLRDEFVQRSVRGIKRWQADVIVDTNPASCGGFAVAILDYG